MYFKENEIRNLESGYLEVREKYNQLLPKFTNFKNAEAQEAWHHGFLRRFKTLFRCLENVYRIYPPNLDRKLDRNELSDLDINLQTFIFNIFGCLDNLAEILVKEKNIKKNDGADLSPSSIGFPKPPFEKYNLVLQGFSSNFQNYLNQMNEWFSYLERFRHSLAHRIPLYVPPYEATAEEEGEIRNLEIEKWAASEKKDFAEVDIIDKKLRLIGRAVPYMTLKSQSVLFHAQLIIDLKTMIEMLDNFLREFDLNQKNS